MYICMMYCVSPGSQHKTGQSAPEWLCTTLTLMSVYLFTARLKCHPVVLGPGAARAMQATDLHQHPSKVGILSGKWYSHVRIFLRTIAYTP